MTKQDEIDSRRLRVFYIDYRLLLDWLNCSRSLPLYVVVPVIPALPDDAQIVEVHADWNRRCFAALVQSKEFDVVLDGMPAPESETGFIDRISIIHMPKSVTSPTACKAGIDKGSPEGSFTVRQEFPVPDQGGCQPKREWF